MIDELNRIVSEVRYLEGGREYPNLDCYGLALYVRSLIGLRNLPEQAAARRDVNMHDLWRDQKEVMSECGFDSGAVIACYSAYDLMTHVAVVVDGLVLECNPKRNASICKLSTLQRRFKRLEFYT